MIEASDTLREALTADARRVRVKATVRIVDPDVVFGTVTCPAESPWSDKTQLFDDDTSPHPPLITLEHNKWLLNGGYVTVENRGANAETGYVSEALSGADGSFVSAMVFTLPVSAINQLRGASVFFTDRTEDGVPKDFTFEVLDANGVAVSETYTDNVSTFATLRNIKVEYPTALRVTITRWSLPGRRLRMTELIAGMYEFWTEDDLAEFEVTQQGNFTGLALPFGTCRLAMDNQDRRFEPRNKDGLFDAIEARQEIDIFLGADTAQGTQYVPLGVYYQHENGWKTGQNKPTMAWDLVDIVGLLQDRIFSAIGTLPTTLDGWAGMLAAQLGENFASRYSVDPDYANLPCTVDSVSAVYNVTCGQILIWVCQATGTFARADAETGFLTFEPYWNEGVSLDLDNLESYPEMSANDDISLISFTLSDGTNVAWNGNSLAASKTANINNPFLHTVEQARKVAEQIITAHGGNQIATVGRGDFTSEIGDVATVQLDDSLATTARVMYQNFKFQGGVLQGCQTKMLQATGGKLYDESVVFKESGTWVCPEGVTYIRLTLGQGGQGGAAGARGTLGGSGVLVGQGVSAENGEVGASGVGGMIWHATVPVVEQQAYQISIGHGGRAGQSSGQSGSAGGHTTFAAYSSVNGEIYPNGYTDILNGDSYGRTGVENPIAGSSDGGVGGEGGEAGQGYYRDVYGPGGQHWGWDFIVEKEPGEGKPGVDGASGFCLIQYVRVENG